MQNLELKVITLNLIIKEKFHTKFFYLLLFQNNYLKYKFLLISNFYHQINLLRSIVD